MTTTKRWAMSPKTRTELVEWPEGTLRVQRWYVARTGFVSTILGYHILERAVLEGYLLRSGNGFSDPFERTAKPLRPYRPRSNNARPYVGVFPWSIKRHWQVMQAHGARFTASIARQLEGLPPRRRWYFEIRSTDWLIENPTQLMHARRELVHLFQGHSTPREYHQKHIALCFHEPLLVQRLMEDMRVLPAFDATGRFSHFDALPTDTWLPGLTGYANVLTTLHAGTSV